MGLVWHKKSFAWTIEQHITKSTKVKLTYREIRVLFLRGMVAKPTVLPLFSSTAQYVLTKYSAEYGVGLV